MVKHRMGVCTIEYQRRVKKLCREKGENSVACKRQKVRIRKLC